MCVQKGSALLSQVFWRMKRQETENFLHCSQKNFGQTGPLGGEIVAVDRDFIVPVQNVKSLQCKFLKASTSKEYEFQSNISKTT